MRLDADKKKTINDDRKVAADAQRKSEKYQKIARKLKVTWRSRVTGVHLLSTFMRIEAYRMFEYDAEKRMYRCFYAHDPGVNWMK
jgi:hypothetical protein